MFSKFLGPKNNYAFQKIFGTERNKDILIHFLNDMLTFKDKSLIQDVNFIKTVQDPETASQKKYRGYPLRGRERMPLYC